MFQVVTALYVDNQSCMKITKNLIHHAHTKHIEVQYHHYIRKKHFFEEVELNYVTTNEQLANILTKPLS